MNKIQLIVIAVIIYALSTYGSYTYFTYEHDQRSPVAEIGEDGAEDTAPRTEPCPLNGQKYSKQRRELWETRRPLGIMIQNNLEARPQSGLSDADVIHEVVAEGGITRFLAIYYCNTPEIVGSVRSARMYYLELLQGFGEYPLYAHVGGANHPGPADALGEIRSLGWSGYNDLDQFNVPFPNYWRDYDRLPGRATEHTVYTNTEKLWEYAAENRKLTNVDEDGVDWTEDWQPWSFQDDAKESERGDVNTISYGFWDNSLSSDYTVTWEYDPATNLYARVSGGEPHIDKNTEEQLQTKNVVAILVNERPANDGYEGGHLLYDLVGESGDAYIFHNGKVIEGTWEKEAVDDMMRFYDESGEEVELVRGQIWISVVPLGNEIDFSSSGRGESLSE